MTSNQIAYFKQQEDARHNEAVEAEQQRANRANEALVRETNLITKAANKERERANRASEYNTRRGQDITKQYNENQRNIQTIANRISEANSVRSTAASRYASDTSRNNAYLNYTLGLRNADISDYTARTGRRNQLSQTDYLKAQIANMYGLRPSQIASNMSNAQRNREQAALARSQRIYAPVNAYSGLLSSIGGTIGSIARSLSLFK